MPRSWTVGLSILMAGCTNVPETIHREPEHHAIGWVNRQFLACPESECPSPTRKTLAVLAFPIGAQKSALSIKAPNDAAGETLATKRNVQHTIHFQYGKALPTGQGQQSLQDLLTAALTAQRLEVVGRTDDIGTKSFNDRLARQRAVHVRDWLRRSGVTAPITLVHEGACCFLDGDKTEHARSRNRRVEVHLVHSVTGRDAVGNKHGAK
jgi:outer membrane protein OmpA-like peptidoglycan-associated protein